ncbi:LysR family transcriptional regulator [Microvirga aerophila]|uniref:Transcriptional regulator n=1 Tax=Microvirga aerophila TaxID=670291 RepID=A0A512C3C5_9HYPH|nr:LysR family transcriptional regulator [Microvirga aerophila]GEO18712.1 transcriptional regulator [Microvirga aerophila]
MDKLQAIRLFCLAVEAKSFASTAHDLDIAASVVSKAIAALEADLRFTLFHRSTRRLSLTEAGATYYESCRQILTELEEAEALARDGVVRARGTLRFGIHPAFRVALVRKLSNFLRQNPEVRIETVVTNAPSALLDEGLDVVLAIGDLVDSTFVARQLGWTTLLTCASPAYLKEHGRPEIPRQLATHRAIIPGRRDEASFARWAFTRGTEREDVDVPVGFVARDGIGIVDAAAGGLGVSRIYDLSATPFLQAGTLEPVLADWACGRKPVYGVFPSRRNVPAKVRLFLDFAQTLLAQTEGISLARSADAAEKTA